MADFDFLSLPTLNDTPQGAGLAPIAHRFEGGATFKGAEGSNSHFTVVGGVYHETTEVPGMKQGVPIKIRTDFDQG